MTINAGASITRFALTGGSTTFAGAGHVVLAGGNAQIAGSGTLIDKHTHTIEGQGNIGANANALINNGLIDANVNGAVLGIDPVPVGTSTTAPSRRRVAVSWCLPAMQAAD